MKIILTRRSNAISSIQSAESYMRVVFSHITNYIWIRDVSVSGDMITVHYEKQGGSDGQDFKKLITDAVRLRGDLTLVSVEAPGTSAMPDFPTDYPSYQYSIVLHRRKNASPLQSYDSMDAVFAHITNYIRIIGVQVNHGNTMDTITVGYEAQPGSTGQNYKQLIEDAVELRGDLTLVSMKVPAERVSLPGIRLLSQETDKTNYNVLTLCAEFLARDDTARIKCQNRQFSEFQFEFEKIDDDRLRYLGNVAMISRPASLLGMPNAYLIFSNILSNNQELRARLLAGRIDNIVLTLNSTGAKLAYNEIPTPENTSSATHSTKP